jgi:hypothetical protein
MAAEQHMHMEIDGKRCLVAQRPRLSILTTHHNTNVSYMPFGPQTLAIGDALDALSYS